MFEAELALAAEVIGRAGDIATRRFAGDPRPPARDDDAIVRQTSLEIDAMARRAIAELIPGDAVNAIPPGERGDARSWMIHAIDPGDAFLGGIQVWATSISMSVGGEAVLGIVAAPALGERYQAVKGSGAWMNGSRIRVSQTRALAGAFLVCGSLEAAVRSPSWPALAGVIRDAWDTRGFAGVWAHMLVARGSADLAIEPGGLPARVWPAASLIVTEAGGRLSAFDGAPRAGAGAAVTSNGALHDQVIERLRPAPAGARTGSEEG